MTRIILGVHLLSRIIKSTLGTIPIILTRLTHKLLKMCQLLKILQLLIAHTFPMIRSKTIITAIKLSILSAFETCILVLVSLVGLVGVGGLGCFFWGFWPSILLWWGTCFTISVRMRFLLRMRGVWLRFGAAKNCIVSKLLFGSFFYNKIYNIRPPNSQIKSN